jgi:hypothetical protein
MESEPPVVQRLFTPNQALLACLLGSPTAGCNLLALNFVKLGKRREAVMTFAGGLVGTLLLFGIGHFWPDGHSTTPIAMLGAFALKYVARGLQGDAVAAHRANGGAVASWWTAVGIGVAWMVAVFAVIFGYFLLRGYKITL